MMALFARPSLRRAALTAAALLACAAQQSRAEAPRPLSEEEAHKLMPRADVAGLTDEQRGVLFDVAGDTVNYAGCNQTLAACLGQNVKDKHAPRMVRLAALLIKEGYTDTQVKYFLDQYYGSFPKEKRQTLSTEECPTVGDPKAPVLLVEFSDYQCPHCAHAVKPLDDLVEQFKGKVRLCSKYFPLPGHPRAMQAAAAAEYARVHGKFWKMHELLFAHQDRLEDQDLKGYAQKLGLDGDEMLKEIYAGKYNEGIERQKKEGMGAGVDSTPTIFFDGRAMTLGPQLLPFSVEDEIEWQRNGGAWDKE